MTYRIELGATLTADALLDLMVNSKLMKERGYTIVDAKRHSAAERRLCYGHKKDKVYVFILISGQGDVSHFDYFFGMNKPKKVRTHLNWLAREIRRILKSKKHP